MCTNQKQILTLNKCSSCHPSPTSAERVRDEGGHSLVVLDDMRPLAKVGRQDLRDGGRAKFKESGLAANLA